MVQNAVAVLKNDVKIKSERLKKGQKACFLTLFFARRFFLESVFCKIKTP